MGVNPVSPRSYGERVVSVMSSNRNVPVVPPAPPTTLHRMRTWVWLDKLAGSRSEVGRYPVAPGLRRVSLTVIGNVTPSSSEASMRTPARCVPERAVKNSSFSGALSVKSNRGEMRNCATMELVERRAWGAERGEDVVETKSPEEDRWVLVLHPGGNAGTTAASKRSI